MEMKKKNHFKKKKFTKGSQIPFKIMKFQNNINKNKISKVLRLKDEFVEVNQQSSRAQTEDSSYYASDIITNTDDTHKIFSSSHSSEMSSDVSYDPSDNDSNTVKTNSQELKGKMKHKEKPDDFSSDVSSSYTCNKTSIGRDEASSCDSKEKYYKKYCRQYGKVSQQTNQLYAEDSITQQNDVETDDSSFVISSSCSDYTETMVSFSSGESQKKHDCVLRGLTKIEKTNEGFFYDFSDCSSDSKKKKNKLTSDYTIDDLYKKTFEIASQKSSSQKCPILSFGVTFKPLKNATYRLFVCGTIFELGNSLFPEDAVGKRVELFFDPDNENRPFFWRTEPICIQSCLPGTSIRYSYYIQVDKYLDKKNQGQMISELTPNFKELVKGGNLLSCRSFLLPKPNFSGSCTKQQIDKKRHFYILDKEYKVINLKPQITYFDDIHESSSNSSLSF